jgi:hypothetical protein
MGLASIEDIRAKIWISFVGHARLGMIQLD